MSCAVLLEVVCKSAWQLGSIFQRSRLAHGGASCLTLATRNAEKKDVGIPICIAGSQGKDAHKHGMRPLASCQLGVCWLAAAVVGSCSGYSELTLDRKARTFTRTKGQGQDRKGQDLNGGSQDKEGQQDKGTGETKGQSRTQDLQAVWNHKPLTNTEEKQRSQLSTRPHTKSRRATPAHTNDAPAHETPHKAHNPNTLITRKAAKRQPKETARSQIPQHRATHRRGHKASSEASCAACWRTTLHVQPCSGCSGRSASQRHWWAGGSVSRLCLCVHQPSTNDNAVTTSSCNVKVRCTAITPIPRQYIPTPN